MELYIILLAILVAAVLLRSAVHHVTVYEYERGLRYKQGRLVGVLGPGGYWIWPRRTTIVRIDVRPVYIAVPGQEVVTADGGSSRRSVL